jgi:prolyl-tRNA synthetase
MSTYHRALTFRDANTYHPKDYAELRTVVEQGFALSYWCGSHTCEEHIKAETKATTRCIPFAQRGEQGQCIYCGQRATEQAVFAKSY